MFVSVNLNVIVSFIAPVCKTSKRKINIINTIEIFTHLKMCLPTRDPTLQVVKISHICLICDHLQIDL